ncbi:hypothetical protein SDC9_187049 [bioreactor metagenome]|uniref:Uncharacterized protein n=1 Tax=bioreactor metagenome TaxID=1076179 RepID=A0A645HKJ1_9ZZZZ
MVIPLGMILKAMDKAREQLKAGVQLLSGIVQKPAI